MVGNANNAKNSGSLMGIIFAIMSAAILITLCWYAYIYFVEQSTGKGVVYIKADRSPFKIMPDDPGGMIIEYTDKKVFDRITGDAEDLKSDLKIIEEERPMEKDEMERIAKENSIYDREEYKNAAKAILNPIVKKAKKEDVISADDIKISSEDKEEFENLVEEIANQEDEKKEVNIKEVFKSITNKVTGGRSEEEVERTEAKAIPTIDIPKNIKIVSKPDDLVISYLEKKDGIMVEDADVKFEKDAETGKNKTTITFKRPPKSLAKKGSAKTLPGFYVQISSHTKLSDLETAWSIFERKYSSVVGAAKKNISEADVSGKKFYRLSFGPYKTKQQATSKCKLLKSKGRDCLLKYY